MIKDAIQPDVYVTGHNILSPLGITSAINFEQLKAGTSGVKVYKQNKFSAQPIAASLFQDDSAWCKVSAETYTRYERMLIASVTDALQQCSVDIKAADTLLVICTTKGNISLLEQDPQRPDLHQRVALYASAKLVQQYFSFINEPLVISNACISGVLGIITGRRLLQSGKYKQIVVTGADEVSRFVVAGFQSFQALSPVRCWPFDAARKGLNLGEGAGTVVLSTQQEHETDVRVTGGATSNDANHISGPSRTGQELGFTISEAIQMAGIQPDDIDLISAHGTATPYNDEMEASAIGIAGVQQAPLFSLKPNYGHTLGAAGLIETVAAIKCLQENIILPSLGFETQGTTQLLNVNTQLTTAPLHHALKTASGFGGCNAALVLSK